MADAEIERKSWDQPADASFAQWLDSRVARFATRRYDWDALKFQADYDPKYRRAQMRYVGTGGTAAWLIVATPRAARTGNRRRGFTGLFP